ncbi:MAG: HU family DNA-binding protein [Maritimibacter sp.]
MAKKPVAKTPAKAPATTTTKVPAPETAKSPLPAKSPVSAVTAPLNPEVDEGPFGEVDLTKKELIQRVVAATGMKPRDVRPVIEATLAELGGAVDRGETLRLNPFGVMQIKRARQTTNGRVVVTKIKRKKPDSPAAKPPLAKAAE